MAAGAEPGDPTLHGAAPKAGFATSESLGQGWEVLRTRLWEVAERSYRQQEALVERYLRDASESSPATVASSVRLPASALLRSPSRGAYGSETSKLGTSCVPGSPVIAVDDQDGDLFSAAASASLPMDFGIAAAQALGGGGSGSRPRSVVIMDTPEVAVVEPPTVSAADGVSQVGTEDENGSTRGDERPTRMSRRFSDRYSSSISGQSPLTGFMQHYTIVGNDLLQPVRDLRFHVMNAVEYLGVNQNNFCVPCIPSGAEPARTGCLAAIVHSRLFEVWCVTVIASNALYLLHTTNTEMSYALENGKTAPKQFGVTITELIFLIFYTLELLLKISVHRLFFFINQEAWWNWFDTTVVVLAAADMAIALSEEGANNTSVSYLRALRLLKVSKVLRMFRVLRFISELRVLLDCLMGCLSSLFWSLVMMAFMLALFSVYFVQASTTFVSATTLETAYLDQLSRRFGSVQDGMLTLFMATSGGMDWKDAFEIIEETGTFNAAVFVCCICLFAVALWNIVTSVFIDRAMRAASKNIECLVWEKRKEDLQDAKDFMKVFVGVDGDPQRTITLEEFLIKMADPKFRTHFEVRGLDVKDAEAFFYMLSHIHGSRAMSVADFAVACMRLKGIASSVDQHMNLFELKRLSMMLNKVDLGKLERRLRVVSELAEAQASSRSTRSAGASPSAYSARSMRSVRSVVPCVDEAGPTWSREEGPQLDVVIEGQVEPMKHRL